VANGAGDDIDAAGNDDPAGLEQQCSQETMKQLMANPSDAYKDGCPVYMHDTDKWCTILGVKACPGPAASDCCKPKLGWIIGFAVIGLAVLVGCGLCCRRCIGNKRNHSRAGAGLEMHVPGVTGGSAQAILDYTNSAYEGPGQGPARQHSFDGGCDDKLGGGGEC